VHKFGTQWAHICKEDFLEIANCLEKKCVKWSQSYFR
jgi:hypothetical protein